MPPFVLAIAAPSVHRDSTARIPSPMWTSTRLVALPVQNKMPRISASSTLARNTLTAIRTTILFLPFKTFEKITILILCHALALHKLFYRPTLYNLNDYDYTRQDNETEIHS